MESSLPEIPDHWCPLTLPHLERAADGTHHFLGRPLDLASIVASAAGVPAPPAPVEDPPRPPEPCWDASRPLGRLPEAERAAALALRDAGVVLLARPLDQPDVRDGAPDDGSGGTGAAPGGHGPARRDEPHRRGPAAGSVGAVAVGTGAPGAGARSARVVSPHPDDATLALGGTVFRRSGRVLNVFSEETWTKEPYYAERPRLTSRLLWEEETAAARVLGAESTALGFVDAADREARGGEFFVADPLDDSFGREEPALFREVTARLADELAGAEWVCAPLAVGGHVDHVACREAVIALAECGALDAARLSFYEDQPYALFAPAREVAEGISRRLRRRGLGALEPELTLMDTQAAFAKQEALRAYRIQVRRGIVRRVGRHDRALAAAAARGEVSASAAAERLWTRFPDPRPEETQDPSVAAHGSTV